MPTPTDDDLVALTGFTGGIVNRARESEIPAEALRVAENVDILNAGTLRRRDGYELVVAGDWHSIWSDEGIAFGVGVKDDDLVVFDAVGTATVIRAGVGPREVSYALLAGRVYWSNGVESGLIRQDLTGGAWALESPGLPNVAAYATGGLAAGEYQVACTFIGADGRESGANGTALVTLTAGQGLLLTGIPQPVAAGITGIMVYVSEANGDVLHSVRTLLVGTTTLLVGVGQRGRQLESLWLEPLPAGQIVAAGMGRLFVASANMLRWSEPMRGALRSSTKTHLRFPSPIDMIVPVGQGEELSGVYVAAGSRVYFLSGSDPGAWTQRIALPTGCIRGTALRVRAGLFSDEYQGFAAFFVGLDGARYLGGPTGQVSALARDYVTDTADTGFSVVRRIGGVDQVITVMRGVTANTLAVADSAVAEVFRAGV